MADASWNCQAERDFVKLLISLYHDHPVLWQVKSKDYVSKFKRNEAVKEILSVLRQYKPDFDEIKFKKKINVLRTNFNKEYQKVQSMKESCPEGEEYQPTLWYYNALTFTKTQVKLEDTQCFDFEETPTQILKPNPKPTAEPEISPRSPAALSKKRKRPVVKANKNKLFVRESYAEHNVRDRSEIDIVAKGWSIKLSRLAPDQMRFAEKIINDTLFEAEMGTLTRNGVRFLKTEQKPVQQLTVMYSSPSPTPSDSSVNPVPYIIPHDRSSDPGSSP